MKHHFNIVFLLLVVVSGLAMACLPFPNVGAAETSTESSQEEQTTEAILNSPRWIKAKQQFDEWLTVQTAYNEAGIEALKSELRNRIAAMSSQELQSFLQEMETKIAVLMSPETRDAQRWASVYTDQARQKIRKKFGVEDPLRLSTTELEAALRQFAADRNSKRSSAAAFDRARESQATAANNFRQTQSRPAPTAASHRPSSRSPYTPRTTPRRPQTYSAPYHKMNYSVGPWGGVWLSSGRR